MYASSPAYGYGGHGQGNNHQAAPAFNPNGAPLQPNLHPHQQQQPGQHQHQQQQQQQQQQQHHQQHQQQPQPMMYNPQQFVGGHPSPYGTASPGMGGPKAGGMGMGMMQNNGMAQMAGPHMAQYQTPYSGSPYGGNIPVSASNLPPNFMPASNAQNFQMNPANMNMNPQQMHMQQMQNMQRMQPPHPSSTPTQPGPRQSPFPGPHNNTPPNAANAQSQFSTPQNMNHTQVQAPMNNQQTQGPTIVTPQTPNFPAGPQSAGGAGSVTPLSPGSAAREHDRVTLLLEINRELLREGMRLQALIAESKKEESTSAATSPDGSEKGKSEKEKPDKAKAIHGRDYVECMRRLQANLAYLAAIADRTHKPSSQIPSQPAILSAPAFMSKITSTSSPSASPSGQTKKEDSENKAGGSGEDRVETLKQQYKKLQELFPGVDPKKESNAQSSNPGQRAQQQAQMQRQQQSGQAQAQGQGQGQGQGQTPDSNMQHQMQNDLMRQRMMQQAQAQAQAQMLAQSQQQNLMQMSGQNEQ